MTYTQAAVERAMKVQAAILRALSGRQSWLQIADVLGVSARTVRRLRLRYQRYGYDGLLDRRRRVPSARRVALEELQRLLRLYRERYLGFNVRHFYQLAVREHGVTISYTLVKRALQGGRPGPLCRRLSERVPTAWPRRHPPLRARYAALAETAQFGRALWRG